MTTKHPAWTTISRHAFRRAMQLGARAKRMGLRAACDAVDGDHPLRWAYSLGYRSGVTL